MAKNPWEPYFYKKTAKVNLYKVSSSSNLPFAVDFRDSSAKTFGLTEVNVSM